MDKADLDAYLVAWTKTQVGVTVMDCYGVYGPTWSSDTLDQCTPIHWSGVNDSKLFDGIILSMALSSICGGMDLHRLGDQRTLYVKFNIISNTLLMVFQSMAVSSTREG